MDKNVLGFANSYFIKSSKAIAEDPGFWNISTSSEHEVHLFLASGSGKLCLMLEITLVISRQGPWETQAKCCVVLMGPMWIGGYRYRGVQTYMITPKGGWLWQCLLCLLLQLNVVLVQTVLLCDEVGGGNGCPIDMSLLHQHKYCFIYWNKLDFKIKTVTLL